MKCKNILALLLLAAPAIAFGQSRALPMLEINPEARAAAMGGNQYGEARNMMIYSNSSSILYSEKSWNVSAASLIYPSSDAGRLKYYGFSASHRFGRHGLNIGIRYQGGYSISLDNGEKLKPADGSADLSYSLRITNHISASVGASYIQSKVFKEASTASFNAAAYYRDTIDLGIRAEYVIGANIANIGPDLDFGRWYSNAKLPAYFGGGGELRMEMNDKNRVNISLSGQYYYLPEKSKMFTSNIGAEYSYNNMIFVRTGYKYAKRDFSSIAFGAGLLFRNISLDAAHLRGLGKNSVNLTYITLGVRF